MIIKKVKLNNIRSYEKQEIEFQEGSTVLAGDIGSGKTSVLLAIEFCLFGLQPGQKGASLLRNGKKEGYVELDVEIKGKPIKIIRGLERSKKSVTQVNSAIEIGGKRKEMATNELKNKVLSELNYPREFARKTNLLYRFTVYTPQEQMKQIITENPETRLDTLRHIFGIDKYKKIRENTNLFTKKLRDKIRNYEGQLTDFTEIKKRLDEKKNSLKEIREKISSVKEEINNKKNEREKFEEGMKEIEERINEKRKYEQELEKVKIMLTGKKDSINSYESEKKNLEKEIEQANKIKFSKEELENKKQELEKKEKEIEEENNLYLEIVSEIKSLNSGIDNAEMLKERISSLVNCPTCFQSVDEGYKKNILRQKDEEIDKNKRKIKKLEEEKSSKIKIIEELKEQRKNIYEEINNMEKIKIKLENIKDKEEKLKQINERIDSLSKDKNMLVKQMKAISENISSMKKYDSIYEKKKVGLEKLRKEEKDKEIRLGSLKKEKELILSSIKEIEGDIQKKEEIKKKLEKISEIEDWLSSPFLKIIAYTERNIMLKLREEFSKLFNEWFNILVPEIFTVKLDQDFTPIIEQEDFTLDYDFLSGGERTAIALAYRLSLNQVINSLMSKINTKNLVMLDEPTDGFSEQQLDKMRDVLNELNAKQLIIVSHEDKIESFVENIIKFEKEGGITKVKENLEE